MAYTPQVEAISPTLPNEETPQDSPLKSSRDYLLQNINRLDREISQAEAQIGKLKRKQVSTYVFMYQFSGCISVYSLMESVF